VAYDDRLDQVLLALAARVGDALGVLVQERDGRLQAVFYKVLRGLLIEVAPLRLDGGHHLTLLALSLFPPQEGLNRHVQALHQHLAAQKKVGHEGLIDALQEENLRTCELRLLNIWKHAGRRLQHACRERAHFF
jgi:hypothetical protein